MFSVKATKNHEIFTVDFIILVAFLQNMNFKRLDKLDILVFEVRWSRD